MSSAQAQEPPEQPGTPVGDGPAAADERPPAESSGAPAASSADREHRGSKSLPFYQELVLLVGIALLLAVVIKAIFLQAFYIPSGSMEDTLVFNDRILVQKVSYWGGGTPQRGDVVVFADPGGWLGSQDSVGATGPVAKALELFGLYPTGGHLVKRVIGVGGDTVKCCDKQGRITVNGTPLAEQSYVRPGEAPSQIDFSVKVEKDHLWVMGDNRSNSADSRFHLGDPGGGQVPVDDVVGKVFAVVWPLGHATFLHRPGTFEAMDG